MIKYLSWRNWAVIEYNSMTENFFLFFYLALRNNFGGARFLTNLFLFYLLGAISTSYGYLINDLSDRDLDLRHGKQNVFHGDTGNRAIIVVITALICANLVSSFFMGYRHFLALWLIWLFISTFYSLPPLRFKERGIWGLALVVPAQRVIPAMLVFSVFGTLYAFDTFILVCYISIRGLMSDIRHQMEDISLDSSTGTKTFGAMSGLSKTKAVFHCLLVGNVIFQMLVYLCVLIFLPTVDLLGFSFPVGIPVVIFYTILLCANGIWYRKQQVKVDLDPYTDRGVVNLVQVGFSSFYFPILLIMAHSVHYPSSFLVLVLYLIIKKAFTLQKIKESFPARYLLIIESHLSKKNR